MVNPPTLVGDRVVLRAPRLDDATALFENVASDPEVTRYLSWPPHPDADETHRVIVEQFLVSPDPTWVIELTDGGDVVGTCGWRRPRRHDVEFGYCLGRRWWRQGIMSEVATMLVDEAQRDAAVFRISAYCHVDNVGSAAVLRRSGLHLEGRLARYVVFPALGPEPQDCLMFAKVVR